MLAAIAAVVTLTAPMPALAKPAATGGAEMQGAQVISWGRVVAGADAEQAFAVITDYDHMADFLPGMLSSKVVGRRGHSVVIEQSVQETLLFFKQRIDVRLEVNESPPTRLTITSLAGSFKSFTGVYELTRLDGGTLIEYRARFVPDFELPNVVGLYAVQRSLQRYLTALAVEIERRGLVNPAQADADAKRTAADARVMTDGSQTR